MKRHILKTYFLGGLLLLAAGNTLTSCDDTLDEVIYSELTDENAFTTPADALAAVNGIYAPLKQIAQSTVFSLNDLPTDGCYKKDMDFEILNEGRLNGNYEISAWWTGNYSIISRANIALDKIQGIDTALFGETEEEAQAYKNRLLGEASFMRGFAYYNLTDVFYTVPLIVDSKIAIDALLPPSSIEELEAQIHNDLEAAVKQFPLPEKYASNVDAGRATKGAALGYLCRLHMRTAGRLRQAGQDASAEWSKALEYADEALKLEGSVYNLQPKVWNIFDPYTDEGIYNDELMFTVRSNPNSLTGSSIIGMEFTPWSYDCGWCNFAVPLEMAWKFDPADERFSVLILREFKNVYNKDITHTIPPTAKEKGSMYREQPSIVYELEEAYTQKYKYTKPQSYNYQTGNNMPLLRFADIILRKAEILNELNGPTQEAVDLINRIRERAFQNKEHNLKLVDYTSKEALRSAICDERLLELNMEGTRRPDLIRMGLWKDRMDKYVAAIKQTTVYGEDNAEKLTGNRPDNSAVWKVYPQDLKEDDIRRYMPVPKRELDLNPALEDCRKF